MTSDRAATKIIIFLRARDSTSVFQDWLQQEFAPALACDRPEIGRLAVNLVDPPPVLPIYKPPSDRTAKPFYDALLQFRVGRPDDMAQIATAVIAAIATRVTLIHAYRVMETVIWDRQQIEQGGQTPGVSFMGRLQFHEDMADSAARRSWMLHATLARRVHACATRYVQNWIVEILTRDTPLARGVPELHFANTEDLMERFFDSPEGRDAVLHDTAHFIQEGPRLYTREFIIRA